MHKWCINTLFLRVRVWSAPSGGSETVYRARTFWCLSSRAGSMPAGGTPAFVFSSPHVFFYFSSPCYVFSNLNFVALVGKGVLIVLNADLEDLWP